MGVWLYAGGAKILLCKKILNRAVEMVLAQRVAAVKPDVLHLIPGILYCGRREPTPEAVL